MELELNAQIREVTGNKLKVLREKGLIPAVVYGADHKSVSIQIDYEEFKKVFEEAGESTLIKLKIQNPKGQTTPGLAKGEETKNVLVHDVAKDPVHDKFIHIDFLQVRMDKVITAEVSLVFEGEAPAVKNLDGILVKNITEVEAEALPKDLPHEIKVDISSLETFDDHIRIKDLKVPEGVKVLADSEDVIASVKPPRTREELEELEEKPEEVVEEAEEAEKEEEEAPTPKGVGVPTPPDEKSEDVGKEQSKADQK
jgi:large subunit ribosomal protein L25